MRVVFIYGRRKRNNMAYNSLDLKEVDIHFRTSSLMVCVAARIRAGSGLSRDLKQDRNLAISSVSSLVILDKDVRVLAIEEDLLLFRKDSVESRFAVEGRSFPTSVL